MWMHCTAFCGRRGGRSGWEASPGGEERGIGAGVMVQRSCLTLALIFKKQQHTSLAGLLSG